MTYVDENFGNNFLLILRGDRGKYFPSKSSWFPHGLKLVPYIFFSKNNFHSPSQPQKSWKIVIMQHKVKTFIQLCLIMTKASLFNSVLLHFSAKKANKL